MQRRNLQLAVLVGLTSISSSVLANDSYQHDASVTYYDNTESDASGSFGVDYRYYFDPVSQTNKPYLLRGFLSQTSNIGAFYNGINDDVDIYRINGEYVFDSKWFVKASYQKFKLDPSYDSDNYSVGVGYYFNRSSSVFFDYSNTSGGYDFSDGTSIQKSDTDQDNFTLGANSYITFGWTKGILLAGQYTYSDYTIKSEFSFPDYQSKTTNTDSSSQLELAADWYITDSWSVGTSYSYDFDNSDNDNWDISSEYYLPISNGIAAVFGIQTNLDSDIDGMGYRIGVNGRF
ncbi:putative porin [Shewanella sp. 1_MG-2023]|uniref:putative porin n=1 Tax=unclassified Shewanella TaxID=196818 RepID=UPI0026E3170E|nr:MULTISPECIES: putative porin [unclassified Shewanella]MDO6610836.1 putative porin [Shewanella sp. 7_MG-2023]MDO6770313.1 putative porin [Shewanella sp. 2_MG-2023]MDO6793454.1 putative porin [Shewanella sp. 1_MG-2023]